MVCPHSPDGGRAVPDVFVEEGVLAKDFVHHDLDVVPHMPVQVHVDRAGVGQQLAHQNQARRDHGKVGGRAIAPVVREGQLLDDRGAVFLFHAGQGGLGAVVGFAVKRRVGVDQVNLATQAGGLLVACEQRCHGQQVVAMDEAVHPLRAGWARGCAGAFAIRPHHFARLEANALAGVQAFQDALRLPASLGDDVRKLFDE
ncbi:hypothetical protein D3C72_1285390 [compost metagenome]